MNQALKVGAFATIVLVLLAVMILKIEDIDLFGGAKRNLVAEFDSVAGLDNKATVRVAGVRIGRVDGIGLANHKAQVRLVIEQDVPLTEGTTARIANMGLLGDKYVVLIPGPEGAPPLPDGALIEGTTPPSFDEALAKFSKLGDSLGSLTGAGGEGNLDRLIQNLEAVSADIRELVEANRDQLDATVSNVQQFTGTLATELPKLSGQVAQVLDRMDRTLAQLEGTVGESRPDLAATIANMRQLTTDAQTSVDNLNQVTGRLARGEGSIGKLLTSDEAHDELVSTLESVQTGVKNLSGALGGIQKIQLDLALESYYLEAQSDSRSAFSVDIDPHGESGTLYRVGIVDSPSGKTRTKTRETTVIQPDGTSETTTTKTFEQTNGTTISALFGFHLFDDSRFWAGAIESSGGVEVEYPLLGKRLLLSMEAFDFDRHDDLDPHLRLSGKYRLNDRLYLTGGWDNFLVGDRRSLFLGGGITWRDDTLKYLLGSVPKL